MCRQLGGTAGCQDPKIPRYLWVFFGFLQLGGFWGILNFGSETFLRDLFLLIRGSLASVRSASGSRCFFEKTPIYIQMCLLCADDRPSKWISCEMPKYLQ